VGRASCPSWTGETPVPLFAARNDMLSGSPSRTRVNAYRLRTISVDGQCNRRYELQIIAPLTDGCGRMTRRDVRQDRRWTKDFDLRGQGRLKISVSKYWVPLLACPAVLLYIGASFPNGCNGYSTTDPYGRAAHDTGHGLQIRHRIQSCLAGRSKQNELPLTER
jgi:hypothetical protein